MIYRAIIVIAATVAIFIGALAGATSRAEAMPRKVAVALAQVKKQCRGFRIISGYRKTRIAGTRRWSLHASGAAVDFKVRDYSCAYRVLRHWRYGLSVDAWRVRHIHISYASWRNEGRFRHGGGYKRYAKRKYHAVSASRRYQGKRYRVAKPAGAAVVRSFDNPNW